MKASNGFKTEEWVEQGKTKDLGDKCVKQIRQKEKEGEINVQVIERSLGSLPNFWIITGFPDYMQTEIFQDLSN